MTLTLIAVALVGLVLGEILARTRRVTHQNPFRHAPCYH